MSTRVLIIMFYMIIIHSLIISCSLLPTTESTINLSKDLSPKEKSEFLQRQIIILFVTRNPNFINGGFPNGGFPNQGFPNGNDINFYYTYEIILKIIENINKILFIF